MPKKDDVAIDVLDDDVFTLPKLKCLKCGHIWTPREQQKPKVCPKCKNPNWNKKKN